ncbi:hypothetical protein G7Z17_g12693 [Cylindrodendrum hubeiense]|uniref:Uncharacterized protein n=1 Tax=Cylindrodendrum hubeiense TaxID=595255 RepID=A0A9P5GXU2_9HYPO|nr:hypothetical protein G7Z17_g12693 [Cylindrodendrum hubeiense]
MGDGHPKRDPSPKAGDPRLFPEKHGRWMAISQLHGHTIFDFLAQLQVHGDQHTPPHPARGGWALRQATPHKDSPEQSTTSTSNRRGPCSRLLAEQDCHVDDTHARPRARKGAGQHEAAATRERDRRRPELGPSFFRRAHDGRRIAAGDDNGRTAKRPGPVTSRREGETWTDTHACLCLGAES